MKRIKMQGVTLILVTDLELWLNLLNVGFQIDRCTNGYITAHSLSDIERNLPVIMNDEDCDKDDEYIIIKYISDLLDMDESFTHWRPVNLK